MMNKIAPENKALFYRNKSVTTIIPNITLDQKSCDRKMHESSFLIRNTVLWLPGEWHFVTSSMCR